MCTEFYIFLLFLQLLAIFFVAVPFSAFFSHSRSHFLCHIFITFWASVLLEAATMNWARELVGERIIVYYDLRNKWPLLWGNEVISVCFAIEWNVIWCLPANDDKIRETYQRENNEGDGNEAVKEPTIRVAGWMLVGRKSERERVSGKAREKESQWESESVWNNGNDIFFPSYFSIIYHRKSKYT